jgi:hypothetical protein
MKVRNAIVFVSLFASLVLLGAAIMGYQDWQIRTGGAPGSPASGYVRTWIDSGAPTLINCKTSAGASCSFAGSTITLQTNGTNNGSQSLLNLAAGTNMTITDNGSGTITFASTGGGGGGMTQISQQTLSSPSATVTFSSIPGSYTNLILTIVAKSSSGAASDSIYMQANTDTGANYSWTSLYGNAGGAGATGANSVSHGQIGQATTNSGFPGNVTVNINGYSGATFLKTAAAPQGYDYNSSTPTVQTYYWAWNNAAAINRLLLGLTTGANFITGSQFTLYGY